MNDTMTNTVENSEELKRWRLILGKETDEALAPKLTEAEIKMDQALDALYHTDRQGGLGSSYPNVNRWLGDIRTYFPTSVVQMMQKDALERLHLNQLLLEPELLQSVEADVSLVATLISLGRVIPEKTKQTAREVVAKVAREIEERLANQLIQAITGSLNRNVRNNRPKHNEIDWHRTIKANLKHYQQDYKTIIPDRRIGYTRSSRSAVLKDIIICVDQSGSMASSVVYSSILAAVMATIKAVHTSLVVFDTAVVDLTEKLVDPVEVLFGTQLGGGTDIARAMQYCQGLIRNPENTILVLITDLYEGGDSSKLLRLAAQMKNSGVQLITLLSLSDEGAPYYDHRLAQQFAQLGIPSFACTPDLFPKLMAAAIGKQDIQNWASSEGIVLKK